MSGLSSLLVRDQIVGVRRIEEALQRQVIHGGDLETNLLELAAVHEDVLAQYRAQVEGLLPVSAWEVMNPDDAACRLLPAELVGRHQLLPLRIEGSTLFVAVSAPPASSTLDELSFLLSLDVVPRITTEMRLAVAMMRAYGIAVPPRLQRLADKVGPVAPAEVTAAQVVPGARSEAARRSALPPLPTTGAAPPTRAGPAPPLVSVPSLAATPLHPVGWSDALPPERVAPAASLAIESPPPVATEPAVAPGPASSERVSSHVRTSPGIAVGPRTLSSLSGADLDARDTPIAPPPSALSLGPPPRTAAELAPVSGSGSVAASAVREPEPLPAPAEDESLAARVMALVGDKRAESETPAVVEAASPPRDDETERVITEPRSSSATPVPRRRAALTPAVAAELLADAKDRDEILELLLQVAHQTFEYAAIFVVHDDVADGRLAVGPGASTEAVRALSVLLSEPSLLRTVRLSAAHYLGPVHDEGGNRRLLHALERSMPVAALVLPVLVRTRVVLLLFADSGRRPATPEDMGVLLATAPRVGAALERLIVARKFAGYSAVAKGERPGLPRRLADLPTKKTRPRAPLPPLGPPPAAPPPAPTGPTLPALAPAERTLPTPPAQPLAEAGAKLVFPAPLPLAGPAPTAPPPIQHPSREPTQPLGARAPASPEPAPRSAAATQVVAVPPPASMTPTVPLPVEAEGAIELVARAPGRTAEPEVSVAPWSEEPAVDEDTDVDVDESEMAADEEVPRGDHSAKALRDTIPAPAPRLEQPPELGPVSGATTGKRRSHPDAVRVDVVSLPSEPPGAEPSVIVDMGPNVEALVASLLRGGEEGDLAAAALQKIGEVALPGLIQRFPGPLLFDRHAQHTRLPRVGDCGPLLRVLPTFRRMVVPYLLPLLASRDPEVRFYSTFLFSEIQYPEAIPRLSSLLFDPDLQTRILAIDVLKGFRRFAEFDEVTKELRETAWIASNPAARRRGAVEAIGELRDAGAVAMLIEMVDVLDPELSDLCWKALVLITRQDFGKVKKKWQVWLAKEGPRHHIEWLIDALVHPSPELRLGASEELKRITKEYFGYYYNLPKRDREKARKRYLEWWERIGRSRFTGRTGS
jgi:hypothetical protein